MAPRTIYANLADGLQPFTLWDQSLADMAFVGTLPYIAVGTNAIALTASATSFAPTVLAYQNYLLFSFVAAATSTGPITLSVAGQAALPVYKSDAVTQAGASDILNKVLYVVGYNSALNGGAGGFQLLTTSQASAGGVGALVQVTTASAAIAAGTPAVAIVRAAPVTTALTLPSVASQSGLPIHVFDWSTAVTGHTITVTPNGAETIMLAANWPIFSNSAQLGSATFYPSTALNGWYIAP